MNQRRITRAARRARSRRYQWHRWRPQHRAQRPQLFPRARALALMALPTAIIVMLALLSSSCIRLGRPPRDGRAALAPQLAATCAKLQTRALWLSLSAIGAGGIGSAASTLSGDVTATAPHWTLVGVGAGMSILGGAFGYLGTWFAAEFTHKGCQ